MDNLFFAEEFEEENFYNESDLGAIYSKSETSFKLWAPTANKVNLLLFKNGHEGNAYKTFPMNKMDRGIYSVTVEGDLNKVYYTYLIEINGKKNEVVDPYAKATGVNGLRGMVINIAATNPPQWENDKKPEYINFTDAIIYELHIRDLSVSINSGISNKGKYIGLIETGTVNNDGYCTGLDHIKELGITHLHLLPFYDYATIDEAKLFQNEYNWGYDPQNYNVPEGSYSTNPFEGDVRIKELKEMIKVLHENGIRVVMDVVFNHTYNAEDSNFNKIVPNYYYRMNNGKYSNGSGCGNELATERLMVRKLIVDSILYWAREYHIDGFRFDLMGLIDIETMNLMRSELNIIDSSIFLYGEGWQAGNSTLPYEKASIKQNNRLLTGIGVFNDDSRDAIKGDVFINTKPGFVNGGVGLEESIKFGIVGATKHPQINYSNILYSNIAWATEPYKCINYVSAHDNLTLWDKISITNEKDSYEDKIKMHKLANSIVLLSQGIPFLHAGVEFLRTKEGEHNSYKSSDKVNQLDWDLKTKNIEVFNYYKGLIEYRKARKQFRLSTNTEITSSLKFFGYGKEFGKLQMNELGVVGFLIKGIDISTICVLFNANRTPKTINIPMGNWKIYINSQYAGTNVLGEIDSNSVIVEPISTLVLESNIIF